MAYAKSAVNKALGILSDRRAYARALAAKRKNEVYSALPIIEKIDRELAHTGSAVARAVLSADNTDLLLDRLKNENLGLQEERANILGRAGFPGDYLAPAYTCPKCEDTGFFEDEYCTCLISLLKEITYKEISEEINPDSFTFRNFDIDLYSPTPLGDGKISPRDVMRKTYEYCKSYAENFSRKSAGGLLLQGATGLGKTHLSLAVASELIGRGYSVIYASAPSLTERLGRGRFKNSFSDENSADFEALEECDLLILDDLGAEFTTSFSVYCIYTILNNRINKNRPTVINTNLDLSRIEEKYTDRIASRIMGHCKFIPFVGGDIRITKRAER